MLREGDLKQAQSIGLSVATSDSPSLLPSSRLASIIAAQRAMQYVLSRASVLANKLQIDP